MKIYIDCESATLYLGIYPRETALTHKEKQVALVISTACNKHREQDKHPSGWSGRNKLWYNGMDSAVKIVKIYMFQHGYGKWLKKRISEHYVLFIILFMWI